MPEPERADLVQRSLAGMPERRMPQVMPQRDRFRQILVQPQRPRDRPRDLRHLQRMRQPRPIVVALRRNEYLCLVGQSPERLGVNDAIPVALEAGAVRAFLHRPLPAPGSVGLCCPIGQGQPFPFLLLFTNSHTLHSPCQNCLYNKNTRWNCVFLFFSKIFLEKSKPPAPYRTRRPMNLVSTTSA